MKNTTFYFCAILLISLFSCDTYNGAREDSSNSLLGDMPNEPGKCYTKCLTPQIEESQDITYASYTGNDEFIMNNYLEDLKTVSEKATSKWVKKKADRNCLSADPNDCLVWCLVEVPTKYRVVDKMLTDTFQTKDFVIETRTIENIPISGGDQVWMPVICEPSSELLNDIQNQLTFNGYDLSVEILQGEFGIESKKALKDYQIKMQLHSGGLTEESMEALGVVIKNY